MKVLDGKILAQTREKELKSRALLFEKKAGRPAGLAVVLVGDDPASAVYVRNKHAACTRVGLKSVNHNLSTDTTQNELERLIESLNRDASIDGILVQMPLPKGLSYDRVLECMSPMKDPDGFTYENLGRLLSGKKRVAACTPHGVMVLLDSYGIELSGRRAVVVGRSTIVGKPMAQLLLEADATVTIAHSKTKNLTEFTRSADIVVAAAGRPHLLGRNDFKAGTVVIDVGIHRGPDGTLCGDVNPEGLDGHVAALSPVPGGVGPMTISALIENTLTLAELHLSRPEKR